MGEIGVVHRYEASGEVHGMMRVREFTQDDAHIFCRPDQIKDELKRVIHLCLDFYKVFGMEVHHLELSTRPDKYTGTLEVWNNAEDIMRQVLKEEGIVHQVNEGDGAFYGPKLDFHLKDSVGRTWQCATIQLDFAQPENFDLNYSDENGALVRPIMIHRVVYGSLERFLGVLTEHYGGVFPLWLSPEQVRIVPIADRHERYARDVEVRMREAGIIVTVDNRSETMQSRIRDAEMEKIPYVLVVGDKEQENKTVAVRPHGQRDTGMVATDDFIKLIKEEIENKAHAK
jgi:threonyl-tRNA synthetase